MVNRPPVTMPMALDSPQPPDHAVIHQFWLQDSVPGLYRPGTGPYINNGAIPLHFQELRVFHISCGQDCGKVDDRALQAAEEAVLKQIDYFSSNPIFYFNNRQLTFIPRLAPG